MPAPLVTAVKWRLLRKLVPVLIVAGILFVMVVIGVVSALVSIASRQDGACGPATYGPSKEALADIPRNMLGLYIAAGKRYQLDWAVLASIGRIETNHGRSALPGVRAGENFAGAGGPMQFIGSTWAAYGVDANGDGRKDRYDPADAVFAAANYLKASGAPKDYERAIYAYNHAGWYVQDVLRGAQRYRGAAEQAGGVPDVDTLPAGSGNACSPGGLAINAVNAQQLLNNPRVRLTASQRADLAAGRIDSRVMATIGAIAVAHTVTITSLKSDHGTYTTAGGVSNHSLGRAVDIGAIDGEACTGSRSGKCGQVALELGRVQGPMQSTELIYCFDPNPAVNWAWAQGDHCDHVHVGTTTDPQPR